MNHNFKFQRQVPLLQRLIGNNKTRAAVICINPIFCGCEQDCMSLSSQFLVVTLLLWSFSKQGQVQSLVLLNVSFVNPIILWKCNPKTLVDPLKFVRIAYPDFWYRLDFSFFFILLTADAFLCFSFHLISFQTFI